MGGQVRHHGAERGAQRPQVGGDRAAARGGTLAGGFVGERDEAHAAERPGGRRAQPVLDDALLRFEGRQLFESERLDRDLDEVGFAHAQRALLPAEVMPAGIEHRRKGNQPDQLGARHPEAAGVGAAADFVEGGVDGGDRQVGQVHGDLGHAVFRDVPADRLDRLEGTWVHDRLARRVGDRLSRQRVPLAPGAPRLPHIERDGVGPAGGSGVEVDVVGHQEAPGANDRRSTRRLELGRPIVGPPLGPLQLLGQSLVLTGPDDGEVAPGGVGLGGLVEVDRNA